MDLHLKLHMAGLRVILRRAAGRRWILNEYRWVVVGLMGVFWAAGGASCTDEGENQPISDGIGADIRADMVVAVDTAPDDLPEDVPGYETSQAHVNPVPVLGNGDGTPQSVYLEVLVGPTWLYRPTDVAFGGRQRDECWVTDHAADAFVVVTDTESRKPTVRRFVDYRHVYARSVTSISFGERGTFATCQESDGAILADGSPNYLAGPTLWPASIDLFVALNESTLKGPFLERMRSSPLCMGVESVGNQTYYVLNGLTGDVDRIDFAPLSRPGGKGKPSGTKFRMIEGLVSRVPGVPSHMAFDAKTGWLYIADTGNSRVVRLDTQSGRAGNLIFDNPDPGTTYNKWKELIVEDFVSKESNRLSLPSGIVVVGQHVIVSDFATGQLLAFGPNGDLVQTLDTGRGSMAVCGLDVDRKNRLVFVDSVQREVVRVHP